MTMQYAKGLHELGRDCWAWLQPDGGWGWSNAGLITDGDQSLLVDTLYNLDLTATMLSAMRDVSPASTKIDILVNSHADGDHTYGNQLVKNARIIASKATSSEFFSLPPAKAQSIVDNADVLGEGAQYIATWVRDHGFRFDDINLTPPTETYETELRLKVGNKDVHLINVGPAHTAGDTLVHSVQDKVVYTADILFLGVHPQIWDGSIDGWLFACDRILDLDVEIVVPGHGPLTDKAGVRLFKRYLELLRHETRLRFDEGMGVEEASQSIRLPAPFDEWLLPERMVASINYLYRQWGHNGAETDFLRIFDMMARYAQVDLSRASCSAIGCSHKH